MRVLLDTQTVVAAYLGDPLPRSVMALLEDKRTERLVSVATIMEIAVRNSVGKLQMGEPEIQEAIRDLLLTVIPFEPRHACRMFRLPLHHRDPFDRMIIATAYEESLSVIGANRQFRRYRGLKVIW
ncbi:MAG: type II toxin-antitoxin system VapC family toxin [Silvibacterium sp.]|nr:type II toxin-antitoxin system VapC family toxin [Silvibacterium sp.]